MSVCTLHAQMFLVNWSVGGKAATIEKKHKPVYVSPQGKVVATAVNAPMVPPEVLAELQPYVALAQGLARAAVQLVSTAAHGFSDVFITYASSRGDDLDTRLLRAMVIKGILEQARPAGFGRLGLGLLQRPGHAPAARHGRQAHPGAGGPAGF